MYSVACLLPSICFLTWPVAVVFGFGDRFVGFFDLGPLVVGVVGVFRLVAFGIGYRFEVAVAVVGVFRFVAERVGDLDRPSLCV